MTHILALASLNRHGALLWPNAISNLSRWIHSSYVGPWAIRNRPYSLSAVSLTFSNMMMPSEQSQHLRCLMAWPDAAMGSPPSDLVKAHKEVSNIANAIAKYEPVWMYAKPQNVKTARRYLSENVTVKPLEVEDLWMRDIGPIFVIDEDSQILKAVDLNFNHWGDKMSTKTNADRSVARRLLTEEDVERLTTSLVAEGGGLEVDGHGTLLATESSIINPNRNLSLSREDVERELQRLLGVTKIIWLPGIRDEKITDCHIDALARFGSDRRTVILSRPNSSKEDKDPSWTVCEEAREVLNCAMNAHGEQFRTVEIEEAGETPRSRTRPEDQDEGLPEDDYVPALSYVNFYLANGAVVMPRFGDDMTDGKAVETMRKLFPHRTIETVDLDWMAYAGGGMHCATQQWPAV